MNSSAQSDNLFIHFSTTLTRGETGIPQPFEIIGKPTIGLLETGMDQTIKPSTMKHKRQWFNSEYVSFS